MEQNISSLQTKIKLAQGLYLVLFLASLAMIAEHTDGTIWALTLGSAVMTRVLLTQPLRAKLSVALSQKARFEDRQVITELVQSDLEHKFGRPQ